MKYHNNPLNIRFNERNIWRGQISPKDGFCRFNNLYNGFRAACCLIKRYRYFGVTSVGRIINRWAPPGENDTDKYISYVCKCMSEQLDKPVSEFYEVETKEDVIALLFCMARVETGEVRLSWKDLIRLVLENENFVQFK